MNPTVGQMVKSEEMDITGVVVDVLNFEDVHNWMPASQLEVQSAKLAQELGSDYKRLFFEVVVDVIEAGETADYYVGEQAIMSWDEFQRCGIIRGKE